MVLRGNTLANLDRSNQCGARWGPHAFKAVTHLPLFPSFPHTLAFFVVVCLFFPEPGWPGQNNETLAFQEMRDVHSELCAGGDSRLRSRA